jgi:hypothetical protein
MTNPLRPPPSAAALAESRRRNNVPADWEWHWCSNPKCSDFVWLDPSALMIRAPRGVTPVIPVCSHACAFAILEALP